MLNKNFLKDSKLLEFMTSTITFVLLIILCIIQYLKENKFWWIILLASILMALNAYVKYKKFKDGKKRS